MKQTTIHFCDCIITLKDWRYGCVMSNKKLSYHRGTACRRHIMLKLWPWNPG